MSENGERSVSGACMLPGMELDAHACHAALRTRDERFDGTFYVAVRTTGIYCRPICPARTPRPENCTFFHRAAQAEEAGFRPCLRCRPELAPGNAITDAVPALARRVVERIEDGAVTEAGLEALAAELGVTGRHLRRVVQQTYGVTPVALVQTQRLLLAKRLLTDTDMRVIDVAYAAGFESLRRFNHLVRTRYRLTPTQIRRSTSHPGRECVRASLRYTAPLDWGSLMKFLGGRAIAGIECVGDDGAFHRTLRVGDAAGWLEVRNAEQSARVEVVLSASLAPHLPAVLARVKRLLDLTANPRLIAERLGPLAKAHPGLRVPGAVEPFELAARAILGQQVTVRAAATLAGRLAKRFGAPLRLHHPRLNLLFPTPAELASADEQDIVALGIVRARARALRMLARAVVDGRVRFDAAEDAAAMVRQLCALPGIGEWTAQYVAMRGLGWPDAFPAGDLVVRRALGGVTARRAEAISQAWQPWRSYAVMHLWKSQEKQR